MELEDKLKELELWLRENAHPKYKIVSTSSEYILYFYYNTIIEEVGAINNQLTNAHIIHWLKYNTSSEK